MTATQHAARQLQFEMRGPLGTSGAVDWLVLAPLILDIVRQLMGCQPTPDAALAYLTTNHRFPFRWRNRIRDRRVQAAVAKAWKGEPMELPQIQAAIVSRIHNGLPLLLMKGLYADARLSLLDTTPE